MVKWLNTPDFDSGIYRWFDSNYPFQNTKNIGIVMRPSWLLNLDKNAQKADYLQVLFEYNVEGLHKLPLFSKMSLFKHISESLERQAELASSYSLQDRLFLKEVKKALIQDLSDFKI